MTLDIITLAMYIAGESPNKEKTRYVGAKGVSKEPEKAARQMITIQKFYGKTKNRRIKHFMISFPAIVDDTNVVKLVAVRIAEDVFAGYQVYFGVHEDTDNLHIHFAANAVSYIDGRKWHMDNAEFGEFRKKICKIAQEYIYLA